MSSCDPRLLEAPDLAERVLAVLAGKAELPSKGIIAGQSVASAIDEVLGTGPAAYNDIDVFLEGCDWDVTGLTSEGIPEKLLFSSPVDFQEKPDLSTLEYEMAMDLTSDQSYQVLKSVRQDSLNYVLVRYRAKSHRSRAKLLIDVFDLNNVQVAINLATRELTYTQHFLDYFRGRELAIVSAYTPFQSLLRYFKKRAELSAYGNDELQVELVRRLVQANEGDVLYREDRIAAFRAGLRWMPKDLIRAYHKRRYDLEGGDPYCRTGTGTRGLPLAIGAKYQALLQTHWSKFEPYFEVWKHPRINVWLLSSRPGAPLLPYLGELPVHPTLVPARFKELRLPAGALVLKRRAEFEKFLCWLEHWDLKTMYRDARHLYGDAWLAGIETSGGWRELQKLLNEHLEVTPVLLKLRFGDQIALMRLVRRELRKVNLPDAWGVFHARSASWGRKMLADPARFGAELKHYLENETPLLPEEQLLPLPRFVGTVAVRELYRSWELIAEGSRMRHCVGGYSHAIESGRSRIISLVDTANPTVRSTIEWTVHQYRTSVPVIVDDRKTIQYVDVAEVLLEQHHAFRNTRPPESLQTVESQIRKNLNIWLAANPDEGRQVAIIESSSYDHDDDGYDNDDW